MQSQVTLNEIKNKLKKKNRVKFKKFSLKVLIFHHFQDIYSDILGDEYCLKKFHILSRNLFKIISFFFKNKIIYLLFNKSFLKYNINIIFFQNNLLCSLIDIKKQKLLYFNKIRDHQIKISNKILKFQYKKLIAFFFKKIRNLKNNYNNTIFSIVAPKIFKKKIILNINNLFKKKNPKARYNLSTFNYENNLNIVESLDNSKNLNLKYSNQIYTHKNILINIKHKKSFNGCRMRKIKIKKNKRSQNII